MITLSKLDTMVSKGEKVVITSVISDNSQMLPYVILTLSIIHLHVVHYNNILNMSQGIFQLYKF